MAFRWGSSFGHLAIADEVLWWGESQGTVGAGAIVAAGGDGPFGSAYLVSTSGTKLRLLKAFSFTSANWMYGFHFRCTALPVSDILLCQFMDGATTQCELRLMTTGQLKFTRNGTLIGSASANSIVVNTWYHFQPGVTISDASGVAKLRVNGTEDWINLSGVDTKNTANAFANRIWFGVDSFAGGGGPYHLANFWVADELTFFGELKAVVGRVLSNGDHADFTPVGAATNAECVNETPANGDTNYNESSTVNHKDTFGMTGLSGISSSASIKGYQVKAQARKSDAGTRILRLLAKSASAIGEGADIALGASYGIYGEMFVNDPNTGSPFTRTALLAAQPGYKIHG